MPVPPKPKRQLCAGPVGSEALEREHYSFNLLVSRQLSHAQLEGTINGRSILTLVPPEAALLPAVQDSLVAWRVSFIFLDNANEKLLPVPGNILDSHIPSLLSNLFQCHFLTPLRNSRSLIVITLEVLNQNSREKSRVKFHGLNGEPDIGPELKNCSIFHKKLFTAEHAEIAEEILVSNP